MKSNIEHHMPAGRYWVCDPINILGPKIEEVYGSGDVEWCVMQISTEDGHPHRLFIGNIGRGPGCFAMEDFADMCSVESKEGYLGVFPESILRSMKVLTKIKRGSKCGWGVPVNMEEDFDVVKTDAAMDIGHRQMVMLLGV